MSSIWHDWLIEISFEKVGALVRTLYRVSRISAVLSMLLLWTTYIVAQSTPTATATPSPIPQPTVAPLATPNLEALTDVVIAYFEVPNPRPPTGDPFTLDFVVRVPAGIELVELPTFTEQWGEFEVPSVSEMQTTTLPDGITVYRQTLTMRLWQPRDYTTPEVFVGYRLVGLNEVLRVPAQAAQLSVPTVLDFNDLTLRPLKPLIDLPYTSPLVMITAGGVALALIGLGYRAWQRRPRKTASLPAPPTSAEIALNALDALKARTDLTPTERYLEVAEILRRFTQAQFQVDLSDTRETITVLRDHLPEKALHDLARIFAEADLIKFAGMQPDDTLTRRILDFARRWVQSVAGTNVD